MTTANKGSGIADSPATQPEPKVPAVFAPPPASSPTTSEPKGLWLWGIGAVLAVALGGLAVLQPWMDAAPVVAVETATLAPVARVLAVNGRIAAAQSIDLRPQVSGTLADVAVTEGQVVSAGQTLLRIDPAAQQAVVRQALAGLDVAQVNAADAGAVLDRTRAMGRNVAPVVLQSAQRAAQTAQQEVQRATATLDQAQIQLQKFSIKAPLSGTVLTLTAEPGQSVDPAVVVMTIADLAGLVVETDVDESYATQIATGQTVALQLAGEATIRPGRVSFVSQKVDAATGGLAVKIVPDAALSAPIGLTVTANITVDDRAAAITVPRSALIRDGQGDAVLVVDQAKATRRPVTVIDWPAARLIVTDGLTAGDVVITEPAGLAPGLTVAVAP